MSNIITDWQTALIELLESAPPDGLGIPFLPMERDGISRERDVGCVFPGNPAYNAAPNVDAANFNMIVRVWKRWNGEPSQDRQPPREAVDQLGLDLMVALQRVDTELLLGRLYFWVTQTRHDYPDFGVEATLLGWAMNPAVLPIGP